jgi:hypothetical protein
VKHGRALQRALTRPGRCDRWLRELGMRLAARIQNHCLRLRAGRGQGREVQTSVMQVVVALTAVKTGRDGDNIA